MDNQVLQIAARIKELRQIIGKSVAEMAEITGTTILEYEKSEEGQNDFSFRQPPITIFFTCPN